MFGRRTYEQYSFSKFVEHKTRLIRSKAVYALHREHKHYFSKSEVFNPNIDARCKVCGILLSEFRVIRQTEEYNSPIVLNTEVNTD